MKVEKFTITDRGLDWMLALLMIDRSIFLQSLNQGATIINIGSGLRRKLEQELYKNRPDLHLISVDPTASLNAFDFSRWAIEPVSVDQANYVTGSYIKRGITNLLRGGIARDYHTRRVNDIYQIPGEIKQEDNENLMLEENSADLILDIYGPIRYVKNQEKLKVYVHKIFSALKSGGKAIFIPVVPEQVSIIFGAFSESIIQKPAQSGELIIELTKH